MIKPALTRRVVVPADNRSGCPNRATLAAENRIMPELPDNPSAEAAQVEEWPTVCLNKVEGSDVTFWLMMKPRWVGRVVLGLPYAVVMAVVLGVGHHDWKRVLLGAAIGMAFGIIVGMSLGGFAESSVAELFSRTAPLTDDDSYQAVRAAL